MCVVLRQSNLHACVFADHKNVYHIENVQQNFLAFKNCVYSRLFLEQENVVKILSDSIDQIGVI